jgi:amino acid adenylation domain-containing protein
MDLYMRDFYQAYETKQLQGSSDFKPFIQFVQLQEQHLERFWKEYLKDLNPVTLFRTMKDSSEIMETAQWDTKLEVTKDQVIQVCKRYNVTEACLFKTLLGITLQMYAQTNDVVFGEVVSGRDVTVAGIDQIGGPTISTIPTRIQSEKDILLQDLFKQVNMEHISRFDYSSVSLNQIETWIDMKPLIEVLFVYQNNREVKDNRNDLKPLEEEDLMNWTQISFPLELIMEPIEQQFIISCSLQNNAYSTTVKGMINQFEYLLKQVIESGTKDFILEDITKLPRSDFELLMKWGTGPVIECKRNTALEPFIEIATESPDLQALEQGDLKMSYGEVHGFSNNVKNHLLAKGVKNGEFVALITERCFGMIIGMFGILKAGAAYIPIDNSMPLERIRIILEESKVQHVLVYESTREELVSYCTSICRTIVLGSSLWEMNVPDMKLQRDIQGSDPAYVVFTSGSTGKPKGVVVSHLSLGNYATVQIPNSYKISNLRIGNVVSITFDTSVSDIFLAMSNSSTLCMKYDDSLDVLKTVDLFDVTPSLLKLLNPKQYPELKTIVVGGEAVEWSLYKEWKVFVSFLNTYGPTETCVISSVKKLDYSETITIGKPLPNTVQYIVNEQLELVPVGVKGELLIGGTGVAIGYLNRPDLTKEKFIPNHFLNDGSRMYRTGDVCRWTEDGEIEIMGRQDDQVKVNGYRIELNEVRDQLEHVTGAEVLKIDNKLVAFVTPASVDVEKIREIAMKKLPHYMIPSMFVPLDQFPLTGNGKVFLLVKNRWTRKDWPNWI